MKDSSECLHPPMGISYSSVLLKKTVSSLSSTLATLSKIIWLHFYCMNEKMDFTYCFSEGSSRSRSVLKFHNEHSCLYSGELFLN